MSTTNGALPRAAGARPRRWALIIIGALVAQAGGILTMVTIASRDPNFSVESDYYEKAVRWDDTARERARQRELAWRIDAAISGTAVDVALTSASGEPLEGASIEAEYFHPAHARDRRTVALSPSAPGRYSAPVTAPGSGFYELRLSITRGPEHMTITRQVERGASPGARR